MTSESLKKRAITRTLFATCMVAIRRCWMCARACAQCVCVRACATGVMNWSWIWHSNKRNVVLDFIFERMQWLVTWHKWVRGYVCRCHLKRAKSFTQTQSHLQRVVSTRSKVEIVKCQFATTFTRKLTVELTFKKFEQSTKVWRGLMPSPASGRCVCACVCACVWWCSACVRPYVYRGTLDDRCMYDDNMRCDAYTISGARRWLVNLKEDQQNRYMYINAYRHVYVSIHLCKYTWYSGRIYGDMHELK